MRSIGKIFTLMMFIIVLGMLSNFDQVFANFKIFNYPKLY